MALAEQQAVTVGQASFARGLFPLPPFPKATPFDVIAHGPGGEAASADELIAAMRRERVGGAFWTEADVWSSTATTLTGDANDPALLAAAIAGHKVETTGPGALSELSGMLPGTAQSEALLAGIVRQHVLEGTLWHDPFTGGASSGLDVIAILGCWRRIIDANRGISAAFGFANWKRDTVEPLLWRGEPAAFEAASIDRLRALPAEATVAIWKARVPAAFLAELERGPWRIAEVEDGFIRSIGLGADCVPPLSIAVDDLGVHYDPGRPSRLEEMLAEADFGPEELSRARALREWLVREGVSKYGVGATAPLPRSGGDRRHVLVVGQVEDDRSMQFGAGHVRTNLELLRRVRALEPDAWIIYRPHPDVEAGHRKGAIPKSVALGLADAIDSGSPISALIALADELHVITSLAGFEALLHGTPVTTHGIPFYAGWGLTRDLGAIPERRGRERSVDELAAAVLLRYPRYLDPVTNMPCTAEILVMRLLSGVERKNEALVPMRRLFGWARRAAAQIVGKR